MDFFSKMKKKEKSLLFLRQKENEIENAFQSFMRIKVKERIQIKQKRVEAQEKKKTNKI